MSSSDGADLRARVLGHVRMATPLLAVYLALTGHLDVGNVVAGVGVSVGASVLAGAPPWRAGRGRVVRSAVRAVVYVLVLLVEVIKCGLRVTWLVIAPRPVLRPGVVAIPAGSTNAAVLAASSHGITITPGEMVLEVGPDGTLYTHCLDAVASGASGPPQQADRARALLEIFGSQPAGRLGEDRRIP